MSTANGTHLPHVDLVRNIVASICTAVCLVVVVLYTITIFKSHWCKGQYSRKQRIFLYLLLASLGSLASDIHFVKGSCTAWVYVHLSFVRFQLLLLFWAALYLCFDVFTTLQRVEVRRRGYRLCFNVGEVCFVVALATLSCGYTAAFLQTTYHGNWCWLGAPHNGSNPTTAVLIWEIPFVFFTVISIVSLFLVALQLCLACRRVQAPEVVNRLRGAIAETTILIIFSFGYLVFLVIVDAIFSHFERTKDTKSLYPQSLFLAIGYPVIYSIVPIGFFIFFGQKMFQDLDCRCCTGTHSRRRGYRQLQGHDEQGFPATAQSPSGTYDTCDETRTTTKTSHTTTTGTYYTCDDSQPPEWFQPVSTPRQQ